MASSESQDLLVAVGVDILAELRALRAELSARRDGKDEPDGDADRGDGEAAGERVVELREPARGSGGTKIITVPRGIADLYKV
jgi:hypothetical protein